LAGRIFDFYLPPLSFREFLNISEEKSAILERFDLWNLSEDFGRLSTYEASWGKTIADLSREYITVGQFPETRQLARIDLKHEYITESVIGKVLDDCIRIFEIDKKDEFKLTARQLIDNAGSIFELKNIGREAGVSFVTLEKYMGYLRESYVVQVLYKYHKSLSRRGRILKKAYTPCVNFTCALNHYGPTQMSEVPQAFGKIIENAIYNTLKQKYDRAKKPNILSFWRKGKKEIDFLLTDKNKKLPIEVKFSNSLSLLKLATIVNYVKKK
jgi:uncharacterized protein